MMNNYVYDFLGELDALPADLYRIHTGHRIFDHGSDKSSCSSSDSGADDDYDKYKPPLYTYEELLANSVEYNGNTIIRSLINREKENIENETKTTQKTPAEKIATELRRRMTRKRCFICRGFGSKHYKQIWHLKKVRFWIKTKLAEVEEPVELKLIFCEECNLPLSGNEDARAHYSEDSHIKSIRSNKTHIKASRTPASVNNTNQSAADLTLQHIGVKHKPYSEVLNALSEKNEEISAASSGASERIDAEAEFGGVKKKKKNRKRRRNRKSENGELDEYMSEETMTLDDYYRCRMIDMLCNALRRNHCYICDKPNHYVTDGNHYRKKDHFKAFALFIKQVGRLLGFSMTNISSVFCLPCGFIFGTIEAAQLHYKGEEHRKYSKYFCYACLVFDNSEVHKNHNQILTRTETPQITLTNDEVIKKEPVSVEVLREPRSSNTTCKPRKPQNKIAEVIQKTQELAEKLELLQTTTGFNEDNNQLLETQNIKDSKPEASGVTSTIKTISKAKTAGINFSNFELGSTPNIVLENKEYDHSSGKENDLSCYKEIIEELNEITKNLEAALDQANKNEFESDDDLSFESADECSCPSFSSFSNEPVESAIQCNKS